MIPVLKYLSVWALEVVMDMSKRFWKFMEGPGSFDGADHIHDYPHGGGKCSLCKHVYGSWMRGVPPHRPTPKPGRLTSAILRWFGENE